MSGVRGEGGFGNTVDQEGVRGWSWAKCFVGVTLESDVVLGSLCQLVTARCIVTRSAAPGSREGDSAVVMDGSSEDGHFPEKLHSKPQIG